MGFELAGLGEVALRQGQFKRATQLVEESLLLRRQLDNKWGIAVSLGILGLIAIREGDWKAAEARLAESLGLRMEIGDQSGCAWCLEHLAAVKMAQGQAEKAIRLSGAASALRASVHSVIDPVDQLEYKTRLRSLRTKIGPARFADLWKEGHEMTLEQAVSFADEGK
jgi:tetratricopeptide (TPR) repeat protein